MFPEDQNRSMNNTQKNNNDGNRKKKSKRIITIPAIERMNGNNANNKRTI
jgi:hypothetical protein